MRAANVQETVLDLNFYRDWVAKRAEALEGKKSARTVFVTISREFGCEGYGVATALTDKINQVCESPWSLFTHQVIDKMIVSEEIDTDMVQRVSENRWSFKDWFVDALVPNYLQSESSQVFDKMRNIILNLADKGNCVILGAGSQVITQRLDPKKFLGLHIRIQAPYSWRLKRVEEIFSLDRVEAENLLRGRQNSRDDFISDFTNMNAADLSLYHLVVNNAKNSPDEIATLITRYLEINDAL